MLAPPPALVVVRDVVHNLPSNIPAVVVHQNRTLANGVVVEVVDLEIVDDLGLGGDVDVFDRDMLTGAEDEDVACFEVAGVDPAAGELGDGRSDRNVVRLGTAREISSVDDPVGVVVRRFNAITGDGDCDEIAFVFTLVRLQNGPLDPTRTREIVRPHRVPAADSLDRYEPARCGDWCSCREAVCVNTFCFLDPVLGAVEAVWDGVGEVVELVWCGEVLDRLEGAADVAAQAGRGEEHSEAVTDVEPVLLGVGEIAVGPVGIADEVRPGDGPADNVGSGLSDAFEDEAGFRGAAGPDPLDQFRAGSRESVGKIVTQIRGRIDSVESSSLAIEIASML